MLRNKIWSVATAILLGSGLAAAAPAPAAAPRVAPPGALQISLGDVSLNKVPFLVAADNGIYAKNGLTVHQYITPYAADKARRQGVMVPDQYVSDAGDTAHISVGGGTPMIVSFTRDVDAADRVIIATFEGLVRDHIISNKSITKLADLKGKRIGYSGDDSVTHLTIIAFARQMGWDPQRDISIYINGNTPAALTTGRIDAFIGSALVESLAIKQGLHDLADLTTFKIPVAGSGLNAQRAWLRNNHDTAMQFMKSSIEAVALIKSNKQAFNAAMVKWFNIRDPQAQDRMYNQVAGIPAKPYPTVDGIKKTMEIFNYREMMQHKAEDFYDASFVTELDKSGWIDALYKKP